MSSLARRIAITFAIVIVILAIGQIFTQQLLTFNWISFMEIQPSYRPMEAPLPVPARSVPVEGAAFIPGAGSPANPIPAGPDSAARGKLYYDINCALCHGGQGKGDGPIAEALSRKPTDLTAAHVAAMSDGELFMVITNGVQPPAGTRGGMPALRENLAVPDRWDVVNYVRTLQGQ